jgi:DNA polymerase I
MADKIQFYPLDINYRIEDEKPKIYLFGRIIDGRQICILDEDFQPYFFVLLKDEGNIDSFREKVLKVEVEEKEGISKVERTEVVDKKYFASNIKAVKVFVRIPSDVPVIRSVIKDWDIVKSINEYDIPFVRRYLLDKKIIPLTLCETEGQFVNAKCKVPVFKAENIKQISSDSIKKPKTLAFDIETYNPLGKRFVPEQFPVIMVAFYGENYKKVITWKRFKTDKDYIEFVDGEIELINRFKEIIEHYKPDILTGYYSDGFDFPYLITRARKYKIELDLGTDYSAVNLKKGRTEQIQIHGIVHLDVFKFVRKILGRSLDTDSYALQDVASELLGEGKHEVELDSLSEIWDKEPAQLAKFCEYNLQDAKLTFNLLGKIYPIIEELVKLIGLPLYDVNRMGYSQLVEGYIMSQVQEFNELAPNKPHHEEIQERQKHTYSGAFVYEPKPGLYDKVVVFDFRSLYPTIIASHNIGLSTLKCECCRGKEKVPGEPYWFCKNKKGFIPLIIEDLITRRMRIKEIMKKKEDVLLAARSEGLKLLANSFYGYLGFYAARWYCLECAKSVTAYGRYYINKVIDKAKEKGYEILYGDSLPYDRHLFIKFKKGDIKLVKIGELYDKYRAKKGISTLAFDKGKKVVFKPIKRVICHKYKGKLLKIITRYGSTIVTPQHSVYSFNKDLCLVDAAKLRKGDKLISLTNPEVKVIYKEGHLFDLADMDLDKYKKELILYSDNLYFSSKIRKCPYCEKEASFSSHIYAKHPERKEGLDKNSSFKWVGGRYAKTRRIPRYWKLDKDLAWLLGFYCAEGSVSDVEAKTGRKCLLSFGGQDVKIIEKVKKLLDAKTRTATKIITDYDPRNKKNMFYYRVQCMPIVALFQYGFKAGKKSEFKKVPWFIFNAEEPLRKAFIKGYLDGDGNTVKDKRYKTHFIRFSTKSKELAEGLAFLLKTFNHKINCRGREIKHIAWKYRKDKPKIQSLRLQPAKESKANFCLAEITSVEKVPGGKYVYDVEVEDAHNFVDAEGMILVHNTDSIFLALGKKTKEEAFAFVDQINASLPGLMELEFEGFYPSGLFVSAKVGPFGAKKKYALLDEKGNVRIKGFETIRRNWSFIAKEVQEEVLRIVLQERDSEKALKYVKKVIQDLREKKIPNDKVVIYTQLQKDVSDYAAVGPHVAIARRLKERGEDVGPGYMIKFIVGSGSGIIRDRAKMVDEIKEGDYDADYYIEHQIVPSVERIFNVLGYTKEDLTASKEQSKLSGFF